MIDKKYHMNSSKNFMNEASCYIHTEMKDGKNCETIICGGFLAMIWGVIAILDRISVKTRTTFNETVEVMMKLREEAENPEYSSGQLRTVNKKAPIRVIDGQDWQEEWIADKDKQYAKKYKKLESEIKKLQANIDTAESIMKNVKANFDKEREKFKAEKSEMQKEIDRLNHRLIEMEERRLFE